MPTTQRSRSYSAGPEAVWKTVGDPNHLTRWWPLVSRVEDVESDAFTELLKTNKGRGIRADFRVVEREPQRVFAYEQTIPGSPFERIMRSHAMRVELAPGDDGGTLVTLTRRTKLRGLSSFGGFMWRRAAARQLDEALDALARIHG